MYNLYIFELKHFNGIVLSPKNTAKYPQWKILELPSIQGSIVELVPPTFCTV